VTATRIARCIAARRAEGKTALVVYLTIGEPNVAESIACARAALRAGADMLELGVPFSDPTADGPVISQAAYRAIQHGGSLKAALGVARELRAESAAPLVLFTYYNPIVAFGDDRLPRAATEAGVDGLLVVDLPPEEGAVLRDAARKEELAFIPLVAPTTDRERERKVVAGASGFVYYVSVTGVTGTGVAPLVEAGREAARLRERVKLPVVVGFGIRSPENARSVASQGVDGVVVGTEVVRAMAAAGSPQARIAAVETLVKSLRQGLDSPQAAL
jgi:tryptophan synthase alpha chain